MNQYTALKMYPAFHALLTAMWSASHLSDLNKSLFETVCLDAVDDIGDDDLEQELVELVSLNYERTLRQEDSKK